jgi:polysaccharide export outer membrane protein
MKKINCKYYKCFSIGILLFVFSSCGINSSLMLKIPKESEPKPDSLKTVQEKYYRLYDKDSVPLLLREDFRMSIDDKFTFTLSTNDGKNILEGLTGTSQVSSGGGSNSNEYLIRTDGKTMLPVVGEVTILGLTIKQAEDSLKKLFSKHYLDPFVQLKVTNKRVIVFPGEGGQARVIYLKNNNTTIMEIIADAGGISARGKTKSIKLIRFIDGKRVIYPIDLSSINGLIYADLYVQANDYIYVEPNPNIAAEIVKQTAPIFAIFSSVLIIYSLFNNIK